MEKKDTGIKRPKPLKISNELKELIKNGDYSSDVTTAPIVDAIRKDIERRKELNEY